jgi:two-component system, OmpR family, sensor histidine kinase VicK
MKKKINLLIFFSAVVLIALSAMQYYLVKTTYEYKVAQFHSEIKTKIATITNDYSDIDSTIFNKKDVLYRQLAMEYILDYKTRFKIKSAILQNQFKGELTCKLNEKFKKEFPDVKMDFAIVLNKFILYKNAQAGDTIFAEKPLIQNKLYGNLNSFKNAFLVRNYVGTTSGNKDNVNYKLLTEDTLYVSVAHWESIILKRMAMVLFFAVFSILTLITLFVIAIKALIKQKKTSDVKTDFINNITHELKTPLSTLAISTKMLERIDIRDNEIHFQNLVNTISRQNNRLQQLIDQVLNEALGENEIELQKEKIVAEVFLDTIIKDFQMAHPSIVIMTDFKTIKTSVMLDKFHLTTAVLNVLENAVKYGCNTIIMGSILENNQFHIHIKDNGIGISKNKHSYLFEKFYRVEQGNLHNTKGLGLGLYYVDQIVKAHAGTVAVVSDLGKGSLFKISIPSNYV